MNIDKEKILTKEETINEINRIANADFMIGDTTRLKLWASVMYYLDNQHKEK